MALSGSCVLLKCSAEFIGELNLRLSVLVSSSTIIVDITPLTHRVKLSEENIAVN